LFGAQVHHLHLIDQAISTGSGFKREEAVVVLVEKLFDKRVACGGNEVLGDKHMATDGLIVDQQYLNGDADLGDFIHINSLE